MTVVQNLARVVLVSCSLLTLATSCQKKEPAAQKKESAPTQKTLKLYLQTEPLSMDPRKGGNRISQVVLRELFEGLMRIDSQGRPAFAVAKSVDISDDKCVYRFHLRPANWSNGMPVTAYDFEFAWKSNLHPQATTAYSYAFYCIKNARAARMGEISLDEVGIKAENESTITVTLEHPAPYFIELTSNPLYSPVCKAVVDRNPNWNNEAGPDFVSNGPFMLGDWKHRTEIVLTKNPHYWDAQSVPVHRLNFPIIENPLTALNMYETGDLDWVGDPFGSIPLEAIPRLKELGKLEARTIGSLNWLMLNVKHPLLGSCKVRKALAMAINRSELVEHLLQGGEKPAFTVLPETLTFMLKPAFADNNVAMARDLFEEGLAELNVDKTTITQLGLTHSSDPRDKALAEAIQQQWQQAFGIKIVLSSADWNAHLKKISSGDFDVGALNWYTFYHDPIYNLEFLKYATASFNGTHWEHPYYIELLDKSDVEIDLAKRDELLRNAEEFLMNEMPVIPICYNTSKFVKDQRVFGESLSPIGMFELKKVDVDGGNILVNK